MVSHCKPHIKEIFVFELCPKVLLTKKTGGFFKLQHPKSNEGDFFLHVTRHSESQQIHLVFLFGSGQVHGDMSNFSINQSYFRISDTPIMQENLELLIYFWGYMGIQP